MRETVWSRSKRDAGVYLFGEYTGPSRVSSVAGSVAVVAVAVEGGQVSAGVRAEASAQASGTNTCASGESRSLSLLVVRAARPALRRAHAGRERAGTRVVPVPTGRRPCLLLPVKRKVPAARERRDCCEL